MLNDQFLYIWKVFFEVDYDSKAWSETSIGLIVVGLSKKKKITHEKLFNFLKC